MRTSLPNYCLLELNSLMGLPRGAQKVNMKAQNKMNKDTGGETKSDFIQLLHKVCGTYRRRGKGSDCENTIRLSPSYNLVDGKHIDESLL